MQKNQKIMMTVLLAAIVLGTYNALIFLLTKERESVFWITYVFTSLSCILACGYLIYDQIKNQTLKEKYTGLSLSFLVMGYFGVQLVINVLLLAFAASAKVAVALEVLLLAIVSVFFLLTLIGKKSVDTVGAEIKESTEFIRIMLLEVQDMEDKTEDAVILKKLKVLEDAVRYSDPVSIEQVTEMENRLKSQMTELDMQIEEKSDAILVTVEKILKTLQKRNRRCLAFK